MLSVSQIRGGMCWAGAPLSRTGWAESEQRDDLVRFSTLAAVREPCRHRSGISARRSCFGTGGLPPHAALNCQYCGKSSAMRFAASAGSRYGQRAGRGLAARQRVAPRSRPLANARAASHRREGEQAAARARANGLALEAERWRCWGTGWDFQPRCKHLRRAFGSTREGTGHTATPGLAQRQLCRRCRERALFAIWFHAFSGSFAKRESCCL